MGFDFARPRVLIVPFNFRRFDLGSFSITTASAASASTTADVDADVVSASTEGGVEARGGTGGLPTLSPPPGLLLHRLSNL